MPTENIEYTIKRIEQMENIFNEVSNSFYSNPSCIFSKNIRKKLSVLTQYYESSLWIDDYTADESRKLPSDLKRGVLSEDGIYNFLCDIKEFEHENSSVLKKFIFKICSLFK